MYACIGLLKIAVKEIECPRTQTTADHKLEEHNSEIFKMWLNKLQNNKLNEIKYKAEIIGN